MNYYILTSEVFESLDKDQIRYAHKSQDRTKWIVTTELTVDDRVRKFQSITSCSNYTFTNHSDWTGDGSGIEEWEIEETEYLSGL
jgi:hypothetical protein